MFQSPVPKQNTKKRKKPFYSDAQYGDEHKTGFIEKTIAAKRRQPIARLDKCLFTNVLFFKFLRYPLSEKIMVGDSFPLLLLHENKRDSYQFCLIQTYFIEK